MSSRAPVRLTFKTSSRPLAVSSRFLSLFLGLLVLAIGSQGRAFGQDTANWIGGTDVWSDPNAWSCIIGGMQQSCVPDGSIFVTITNGTSILDIDASTSGLTLDVGGNLDVGSGFSLVNLGQDVIGVSGSASLSINTGGLVSDSDGVLMGEGAGSVGTAIVDGGGSQWNYRHGMFIALFGQGTLAVQNGATVAGDGGAVGYYAGGSGTVTVSGSGSQWTNTGEVVVGVGGQGTLTIQNGGVVTSAGGSQIGLVSGGMGSVTITGSGSQWRYTNGLTTGQSGQGTLTITDGGALTGDGGNIGLNSGGVGMVTVSGSGSQWTNQGYGLTIGASGTGTLTIEDGGMVTAGVSVLGYNSGGGGDCDGTGSQFNASGELTVGLGGQGNLTVQNGATGTSANGLTIGGTPGSMGTVTIGDPGSRWTNTGSQVVVGDLGAGQMSIENAAVFSNSGDFSVGDLGPGTLTVSGAAQLSNTGTIYVGYSGEGIMNLTTSGKVTTNDLCLGCAAGGIGRVNLSDFGTQVQVSGTLLVGDGGQGIMEITDGATVSTGSMGIGEVSSVTVAGVGANLNIANRFIFSGSPGAVLTVSDGGMLTSADAYIGGLSTEAASVVINGGSWRDSGVLDLSGGAQSLTIENGGSVARSLTV
jgi:T5SS/PEP-CTERM-associated repeat protein